MKINKTIQNELDKLSNDIKNKYGLRINIDKTGLAFESKNKDGYINIKFDRSFNISSDDICINIKNKKVAMSLWNKNYLWHLTVY